MVFPTIVLNCSVLNPGSGLSQSTIFLHDIPANRANRISLGAAQHGGRIGIGSVSKGRIPQIVKQPLSIEERFGKIVRWSNSAIKFKEKCYLDIKKPARGGLLISGEGVISGK